MKLRNEPIDWNEALRDEAPDEQQLTRQKCVDTSITAEDLQLTDELLILFLLLLMLSEVKHCLTVIIILGQCC